MVVTIDSKFYSKLQLGISKYQEKTPADPLNSPTNTIEIAICRLQQEGDIDTKMRHVCWF